jgi:putative protease
MTDRSPKPELLAPAGSLEAFFAAMEAGADAVYCGLQEFSARAKARNLSLTDLEGMLGYARQRGRRIYITLNTLIKEAELPRLAEILAALEALAVDGVILQDLAVWRLARRHFPGLALHASTQMTVHNAAGLHMLERMGFSRAVLARELTLEEIANLRRQTSMELEHFIHGALCFSFSGQCYFSSWLGGKSGNRGRCAQPCRRRYRFRQKDGYYFSPNDLSAIDLLPELAAAGICSFKIEGRMKSAEYVANVVGAYRRALDAGPAERRAVLTEAKELLKASFGRLPTKGFLTGPHPTDIAIPSLKGATGRFLGEVQAVRGGRITFKSRDRLHVGDRLRVQPKSDRAGTGFTVRELQLGQRPVKVVPSGALVTVPSPFRDSFHVGDTVFKVSSEQAFTLSEAACRRKLTQAGPAPQSVRIALSLADENLTVAGQCGGIRLERSYTVPVHSASSSPLSAATLEGVFQQTGSEPFLLSEFSTGPLPAVVIPPSRLKELRRDYYRELRQMVEGRRKEMRRDHLNGALADLLPEGPPRSIAGRSITLAVGHPRDAHILGDADVDRVLIPFSPAHVQGLGRRLAGREAQVVWDIPFIIFEQDWSAYRSALESLQERGFRAFRLNNLGHFALFDDPAQVELSTGYRLYTLNSQAAQAWAELGVRETTLYVEDDRDNLRAVLSRQRGSEAAVTVYASVPLITSRIAIRGLRTGSHVLSDRGDSYRIDQRGGLTQVSSDCDFSLLGRLEELQNMGCGRFIVDLSHLGPFSPAGKQVLEALRRGQGIPGTSLFNYETGME